MKYKYLQLSVLLILFFQTSCKKDQEDIRENILPEIGSISPETESRFFLGDTVNVIVQAFDNDGEVQEIRFYEKEKLIFTDNLIPFEYQYLCQEEGSVSLKVIAVDNDREGSLYKRISLHVDRIPLPEVSMEDLPWGVYVNETFEINVSASTPVGHIVSCTLLVNDTVFAVDSLFPFVFTWSSSDIGKYVFKASAKNSMGATKTSYGEDVWLRENSPPSVRIMSPSSNGWPFIPGNDIEIRSSSSDSDNDDYSIEYYDNGLCLGTSEPDINFVWEGATCGRHAFFAVATDVFGNQGYSDTIYIEVLNGIPVDFVVNDLEKSNSDQLIFGIAKSQSKLLLIDPEELDILEVGLPKNNPLAIKYSSEQEKLYIVYETGDIISVYDQNTAQLSEMDLGTDIHANDLAIDDQNQRLYLSSTSGLNIYDLQNYNLIAEHRNFLGDDIEINSVGQILYSVTLGAYPSSLYLYDVEGDGLSLQQSLEAFGNDAVELFLHPDNGRILAECRKNTSGRDYDAYDLNNVLGAYQFANYISHAMYSVTGDFSYFLVYGSVLIFDSYSYNSIGEIYFPNSSDCQAIVSFDNDQKLMAFSYSPGSSVQNKVLYILSTTDIE